jgi:hypothetical protein
VLSKSSHNLSSHTFVENLFWPYRYQVILDSLPSPAQVMFHFFI